MEERSIIAGRREFESVFMNAARAKRNWQIMAFAVTALLCVREASYQYYAAGSRVTPYVVEVDRFGRAQAFGAAEPLKATDRRVMIAQLAGFIRNVRTVLPDANAQAEVMRQAYAFVDQTAAEFLNDYFSKPVNDPRALGEEMTRTVEVTSVLEIPGTKTWKVQWTEQEFPRQAGGVERTVAWEAYLQTKVVPPKTTERIEVNPLGVYVTGISWGVVGVAGG